MIRLVTIFTLFVFSALVNAQPNFAKIDFSDKETILLVFDKIDANWDEQIDTDEFLKSKKQKILREFGRLDHDGDMVIGSAEYAKSVPVINKVIKHIRVCLENYQGNPEIATLLQQHMNEMSAAPFGLMDYNNDGQVDLKEYNNHARHRFIKRFATIDKDSNRFVSRDEFAKGMVLLQSVREKLQTCRQAHMEQQGGSVSP